MLKNLAEPTHTALTQKELNGILQSHDRYITRIGGGMRAKLSHAKLDGLNLANRNLSEADFSGASLVGANFVGSNLEGASFYCANLRDCNLHSARLRSADLRGACFSGARLAYAVLDSADLREGTMMHIGAGGVRVLTRGKAPTTVDFSNCSLKGASFGGAKLDGANFNGAILEGANFKGAKLANVSFQGAVLTGVDLKDLPQAALAGAIIDVVAPSPEKLAELRARIDAHKQWIASGGKESAPAVLDGEDLRPFKHLLLGAALSGLSARNAICIGLDFTGARFQAAKFDGADLRDCDFTDADLRGISLRNARLAHARFDKADLTCLPLTNGKTLAPDLTGADASAHQFSRATLDTPLPDLGLTTLDVVAA